MAKGTVRRDDRVTKTNAGAGSFLDPPTYPTHEYGIETDLRRRPENRGYASLTYVLTEPEGFSPQTVSEAKRLLDGWKRPPIDDPEIQDWIAQVLGYFRACYRGDGDGEKSWNAGELSIERDTDPVAEADRHAGVHLIRKFYPEFVPTADDFARAYWGTKPGSA